MIYLPKRAPAFRRQNGDPGGRERRRKPDMRLTSVIHPEHEKLASLLSDLKEQEVLDEIRRLIAEGETPSDLVASCQKGMQRVAEQYENRFYYISGLIMAGEIMRQVSELLDPYVQASRSDGTAGRILLGTVEGDIHDIGKDLLKMVLRCSGSDVMDIGVDVPAFKFVQAVQDYKPHVVGLSALVTEAHKAMRETIRLIHSAVTHPSFHIPIIVGGGMIDEKVARYVGADHWAPDAVMGATLCRQLVASLVQAGSEPR